MIDYKKTPCKNIEIIGELKNRKKEIISIITPFYNGGKTLEETYKCVVSQTYPFFEWIIVDDGSKDKDSLDELDRISKLDNRIKVFHKENEGPSLTRDYGINKTSNNTKYVYFLDCDDLIDKTTLEVLYWSLETHSDCSFAYTSIVNFGKEEYIWEKYLTIEQEKIENQICVSAMVKKEDLLSVGCFGIKEKNMYEDWNLWLKLIAAGKKPLRVSAPLFWYRKGDSGELSRANNNKKAAMRYVNDTIKTIKNDVEVVQFPRLGNKYTTVKPIDNMVLPEYKKDDRITILYLFPWMVVGGADFFNLELIKRLDKTKYRAIILTTTPSDNPIRQDFEDYAEVYDMASFLERNDYINFAEYIITSRKIDLVFVSNTEYGYYMVPYLKSKYSNIPFIDYIHCIDIDDERKGFARCSRDVTKYLSHTYCCNNSTLRELKEDFGIKNAETIYIGTDEEKFNPKLYSKKALRAKYKLPQDKIIISFIARLADQKRPEMFVEIAKRIYEKNNNVFFVIAGDGPLMPKVKQKVDSNFKLLGMVKETEEIYSLSDLTLNCSTFEGLALTSYESLSMGVPVISTDAGGQSELIDNNVGAIIHFNENPTPDVYNKEIEEYVKETLRVIKDLDNISNNCRKKIIEGFTLNLMVQKFDKIFENSIKEAKKDKYELQDYTSYELALEDFYINNYFYTKDYIEKKFSIYLDTIDSPMTWKRKLKIKGFNICAGYGIVEEVKTIMNFIYQVYYLTIGLIKFIVLHLIFFIKFLLLSIPACINIIGKYIKAKMK